MNEKLRRGPDWKMSKKVQMIEENLIPLNELLKNQTQPIILYRATKKPFDSKMQDGFLSASNVPLVKFGSNVYPVIVFPTTKVGFCDISVKVNKRQQPNTVFELFVSSKVNFESFMYKNTTYLIPISK